MASPSFAINGGTVDVKASVAASGAVQAIVDSTDDVRSVTWEIASVDDSSDPSDYTLTPSGSVGQQVDTTALLAGTAAVLRCTINGGILAGNASPTTTVALVKFYVPTLGGLEVLTDLECSDAQAPNVTSGAGGSAVPLNLAIRNGGGGTLAANAARGGVFGRMSTDLATWTDVGTILVDLQGVEATGRVVNLTVAAHTTNAAIATEVRLFNLDADTPAAVTLGSAISSTNTSPEVFETTITEDVSLPDDRVNRLLVQIQKASVGVPADLALLDIADVHLSY